MARTLSYHVATSLDGYIAAPDGTFDDFVDDADFSARFLASLDRYDAVVMGRSTWQVGADLGTPNPFPFLDIDKVVASRSLAEVDPAVRVVDDGVAEVARMKAADGGPIWLCGGGDLAAQLLDHGLVDEVVVKHNPVLLGDGIGLFGPPSRRTTRLRTRASTLHEASGIRTTTYDVLG